MNEKNLIKIEVHNDISIEFIDDFKTNLSGTYSIIVEKQKQEYSYASGEIFSDIIIYFDQHLLDIIISGVALRATYDIVKAGLIKLYKKLKNNGSKTSETKKISLRHRVNDKIVEFELETNFSEEAAERIIHKSFEQANNQDLIKIISNQKYLSKDSDFKYSKFIYNQETGLWEPIDYGKIRSDFEKWQKDIENNFNS